MTDDHFAVVLGLSPTGLYAVRELGRAGVPVAGVAEGVQCGAHSRFLTIKPIIQADDGKSAILNQLEVLAQNRRGQGVLIPTSDRFIEFVVNHRARLLAQFRFQETYEPESYQSIVDKARLLDLCRAHDVDFPAFHECNRDQLRELESDLKFPIILKPALIHRVKAFMAGKKVLIAQSKEEFSKLRATLPDSETNWLVQEIVPGPESNITLYAAYVDRTGQPQQAFTAKKLRQYVAGFGSASLVLSADLEETRERSEFILKKAGFKGIAGTEFKRDPRDGRLKMIEINPRPTLWFGITHAAGKRIADAAYCDLTGQGMPDDIPQQNGVLWRYLWKDMYAAAYYRLKGGGLVLPPPDVRSALSDHVTARMGPVFDRTDLGPGYGEVSNYARKLVARLKRRSVGRP